MASTSPSASASASSEATPHFLASKTIIVAGAGIAGLSFAIAVALSPQQSSTSATKPKVKIYERDSYDTRIGREGYSLSLRTDNNPGGIQVLDMMGLYERVRSVSVNAQDDVDERGGFNVWDVQFRPLLRFAPKPLGPKGLLGMRIRRNALQKVLADAAVEAGAEIHWGTAIKTVEHTPTHAREGKKMQVSLSDGSVETCDLLIAADGSRSKVRSLLRPSETLDYTGVFTWGGTARYPDRAAIPKPVDRDWGVVLGAGGFGLFVSPVDDKSVLWGLSRESRQVKESLRYPIPQKEFDELMEQSTEAASHFGTPLVRELVAATDPTTVMLFSAMDRPPFPNLPLSHGPVVWIGDANHAVSPFAGNGANMAIMDAWDLANSLNAATCLEEALAAYDKLAVPRAQNVLRESRWSIGLAHATGLKLLLYKFVVWAVGFLTRNYPV